jgi:sec-independent protein translocase protein TatA
MRTARPSVRSGAREVKPLACDAARGDVRPGVMPHVGFGELLVIGFVLLVVFSASRMASLGNALGKFVYSFKKASQGQGFIDVKPERTLRSGERDRDGKDREPEKR